MARFPSFPLWTDAYLADTGHLTTIEHGAYLLLLITMWRAGGKLPNDDKQLARYARLTAGQWARIKPNMMAFFTVSSDGITQGRLTDELGIVKRNSEKQSNSAKAKWRKENNKRHAGADANVGNGDMPDGCQPDAPISTPTVEEDKSSSLLSETSSDAPLKKTNSEKYPPAFEAFWQAYPRSPNMSKSKALAGWKKLTEEQRAACAAAVPAYKAFLASKTDHPTMHATTFINERRFEGFLPEPATAPVLVDDDRWRKRLVYARERAAWPTAWGPRPRQPGCSVPAHLLEKNDGLDWNETETVR